MALSSSGDSSHDFVRRVERRLDDLTTRTDSIQTLSHYALHHKANHNLFVQAWEKVLRANKDDVEKRIALFYACNDIVQNCRRKSADGYLKAFEGSLQNSLGLFREPNSVFLKVERVLKIWQERKVFSSATVNLMLSKLNAGAVGVSASSITPSKQERAPSSASVDKSASATSANISDAASMFSVSDIVSRFKSEALIDKLRQQAALDSDVSARAEVLKNLDVDVSDIQVIGHLKNKSEGKEFCDKFERSYTALQTFVSLIEKQAEARRKLAETLENAEVFYDTQYVEVKKISHVYNKYLHNVNQVIKKTTDRLDSLPSPVEDEPRTPSTLDGSESNMDIETANEAAFCVDFASNGRPPPLPLPPMPPMLMGMIPPPSAFEFPNLQRPPPPPPPPPPPARPPPSNRPPPPPNFSPPPRHFRSPPPNFGNRMPSPRVPHRMPPPRPELSSPTVPPPNNFGPPPQRHPSPQKLPTHGFNFPPPPLPHSPSGNIPTLIGGGRGVPISPQAGPPPGGPMGLGPQFGNNGQFSGGKRKRSFEGDDSSRNHVYPGYMGESSKPDANLIPAQPIMPQVRPISTISTIVGVRRSGPMPGGPGLDPRLSGGFRGRGGAMRGRGGFGSHNF